MVKWFDSFPRFPLLLASLPRFRFASAEVGTAGVRGGVDAGWSQVLDLMESGGLQEAELIPDRDRAPDSLGPGLRGGGQGGRQIVFPNHIGEEQLPARAENPINFRKAGGFIG